MIRVVSKRSGMDITPGVDVFTDGRCLVRTFDGDELQRRISPADVDRLLGYFEEQRLLTLTDDIIDRSIEQQLQPKREELPGGGVRVGFPSRHYVTDCNYTSIAVRTAAQTSRIERYALSHEIEWYPQVAELQTVQQCVQRVYDVIGQHEHH